MKLYFEPLFVLVKYLLWIGRGPGLETQGSTTLLKRDDNIGMWGGARNDVDFCQLLTLRCLWTKIL